MGARPTLAAGLDGFRFPVVCGRRRFGSVRPHGCATSGTWRWHSRSVYYNAFQRASVGWRRAPDRPPDRHL